MCFSKSSIITIFFVCGLILSFIVCKESVFFYTSNLRTFANNDDFLPAPELNSKINYNQLIPVIFDNTKKIGLQFANYLNRNNHGVMRIVLSIKDRVIGEKKIDVSKIADNEYIYVELSEVVNSGQMLNINVASDSEQGEGVTIWTVKSSILNKIGAKFLINGEPSERQLNIAFCYESPKLSNFFWIVISILIFIYYCSGVPSQFLANSENLFVLKKISFYILLLFIGTVVISLRNMDFIQQKMIYAEEGWFLSKQILNGFFSTLFSARSGTSNVFLIENDFWNTGIYIISFIALKVNMAINGYDLSEFPFWSGVITNIFISFTAVLGYRAIELMSNWKIGILAFISVILVYIGNESWEVFGRSINVAFLWTTTVAFLLIISFIKDEKYSFNNFLISIICIIGCFTFPIVFLEVGLYLMFVFFRSFKDNEWKKRVLSNTLLLITVLIGCLLLPRLIGVEGASSGLHFVPERAVEFFIARHFLFPLVSEFYTSLNDKIVIILFVVYTFIVLFANFIECRTKSLGNALFLFSVLTYAVCISSAYMRRGFTQAYDSSYIYTHPARYFYSCNIISFLLLTVSIFIVIRFIVKNKFLFNKIIFLLQIICFLIIAIKNNLFYFLEINNSSYTVFSNSCRESILKIDEFNDPIVNGIRVNTHPAGWSAVFPFEYVIATSSNNKL